VSLALLLHDKIEQIRMKEHVIQKSVQNDFLERFFIKRNRYDNNGKPVYKLTKTTYGHTETITKLLINERHPQHNGQHLGVQI